MNKKTLIIIIASILAIALIATGVILVLKNSFLKNDGSSDISSGSSDTVITVGSVSGKVDKKVTVPVSIKGNPGFMAMLLEFNYDTSVLKYKGYTQGDFLTDYQFNDDNGTLRFLNLEDGDVKDNGVLVNLEFEIVSDSAEKTDIKLTVASDSIANQKEQLISATGENGTVTINK